MNRTEYYVVEQDRIIDPDVGGLQQLSRWRDEKQNLQTLQYAQTPYRLLNEFVQAVKVSEDLSVARRVGCH